MADIANGVCPGTQFTFEGKTVLLAPCDRQDIQGMFERWMEKRAWEKLAQNKTSMSEADYEKNSTGTRRDIASGVYSWLSEAWVASIQTPPGQIQLTFLCLKALNPDPDLDHAFAERLYWSNQEQIVSHIVGTADPNRKRPAAATAPA